MDARIKVVVDGANVAYWHGKQTQFSPRGILLCIAYFKRKGHRTYVFLPQKFQRSSDIGTLVDGKVLTQLHNNGIVSYVPVGNSDDSFIIQTAQDLNAIIVSNDLYRNEISHRPDWTETVRQRRLSYTFANDTFCPDPNPIGIPLEEFLFGLHLNWGLVCEKKKSTAELLASILDDKDYSEEENMSSNRSVGSENLLVSSQKHCRNVLLASLEKNKKQENDGAYNMKNKNNNTVEKNVKYFQQEKQKSTKNDEYSTKNCRDKMQNGKVYENTETFATKNMKKRFTYGVGFVTKIEKRCGFIEADGLRNQVKFISNAVDIDSGTNCADMRAVFNKNEEVIFATGHLNVDGIMEASMVCHLDRAVHGYGKLVGEIRESTAIISPEKYDGKHISGSIFCPGSAFKDGTKLKTMKLDDWVEFYAIEQTYFDDLKFKFIAVKTQMLTTEGVFVRITDKLGVLWTKLTGLVVCLKSKAIGLLPKDYRLGVWIQCQIREQSEKNGCKWYVVNAHRVPDVLQTNVNDENEVEIEHFGTAGFIQLKVERIGLKNKKVCYAFLKNEKYGEVFARSIDCPTTFNDWKEGQTVYAVVVAQELPNVMWRAFCVDKNPLKIPEN